MQQFEHTPGSIYFTFFGVPTIIRPSSWLVLLILGSGLGNRLDIMPTLIFMVAGMLCLLAHEYGHAFCCRAQGGGSSVVEIASLGGVTISSYPPRTRGGHILMVLAGPVSSLLLGIAAGIILGVHLGLPLGKCVVFGMTSPLPFQVPYGIIEWSYIPVWEAMESSGMGNFALVCYSELFFVSVWWSLFNLLPIYPMDGGKTLYLLTENHRLTGMVGIVVSVLLGIWALQEKMLFTAFICAWFVWLNWQYLRYSR